MREPSRCRAEGAEFHLSLVPSVAQAVLTSNMAPAPGAWATRIRSPRCSRPCTASPRSCCAPPRAAPTRTRRSRLASCCPAGRLQVGANTRIDLPWGRAAAALVRYIMFGRDECRFRYRRLRRMTPATDVTQRSQQSFSFVTLIIYSAS